MNTLWPCWSSIYSCFRIKSSSVRPIPFLASPYASFVSSSYNDVITCPCTVVSEGKFLSHFSIKREGKWIKSRPYDNKSKALFRCFWKRKTEWHRFLTVLLKVKLLSEVYCRVLLHQIFLPYLPDFLKFRTEALWRVYCLFHVAGVQFSPLPSVVARHESAVRVNYGFLLKWSLCRGRPLKDANTFQEANLQSWSIWQIRLNKKCLWRWAV